MVSAKSLFIATLLSGVIASPLTAVNISDADTVPPPAIESRNKPSTLENRADCDFSTKERLDNLIQNRQDMKARLDVEIDRRQRMKDQLDRQIRDRQRQLGN
ncbi:hypothetical protein CCHL11_07937 [Colletotrichum chlorophyti]|uniref:Uncharacterized protein n=1 Tax=Colletotrichum chlorophyti TaxID=708187 RepID=A0A1Q8S8H2_9PEZI|nr:hypothetical protein CCHL11_07937 [Colletotrichum chlorophyti]